MSVKSRISLTIPLRTEFQFRNTHAEPLKFIIITIPPWPGPDEAVRTIGHWSAVRNRHAWRGLRRKQ